MRLREGQTRTSIREQQIRVEQPGQILRLYRTVHIPVQKQTPLEGQQTSLC